MARRKESLKKTGSLSKIPFENAYVEDCYKYIITAGNNSGMIRKAMQRRIWWIEIQPIHTLFNFKWQPFSGGINFKRLSNQTRNDAQPGGGSHSIGSTFGQAA